MKKLVSMSLTAAVLLVSGLYADQKEEAVKSPQVKVVTVERSDSAELAKELKSLKKALKKAQKKIKKIDKKLNKVKAHDAFDNVKFNINFRNAIDNINYKYNKYSFKGEDWSGTKASNHALLTSRLYLNMKSSPMPKLTFSGQIAMYSTWGGSELSHDKTLKDWSESSKATDTIFRIRQAYFVWSDTLGDDGIPYAFSIGRRQSTDGFLANFRENNEDPGSPLAHVTNMEVNGIMLKLDLEKYIFPGTFVKFVYGRAHSGGIKTLNDLYGYKPYAQEEGDIEENVDFFVVLGSLYNDGQYNLMFENATILNTKGARTGTPPGQPLVDENNKPNKSLDAGTANLSALSLQV
ncbi:MAG: hypothetical protein B6D59_04195, partial [Campylobacteraceae bacterium 4484_4]